MSDYTGDRRSPKHNAEETWLSEQAGAELDSLLAQWAAPLRLSELERQRALKGITIIRPDMGDHWWKQLFSRLPFQPAGSDVPGLRRAARLQFAACRVLIPNPEAIPQLR